MNTIQRPSINQASEAVRRSSAQELLDRTQALLCHVSGVENDVRSKL